MGKPAATISHFHICPKTEPGPVPHVGGPITTGSPDVEIGGDKAARKGDTAICIGPPDTLNEGSASVFINGQPAVRLGDGTAHGGKVVIGNPTVLIGDGGGDNPEQASTDLSHLPPPPQSFAEAKQRLNQAQLAIEKNGGVLPTSPFSTADKMRIAQDGLQEKVIVRIIESKYSNDTDKLGPPSDGPGTYWTTTFTQIEHLDHDAKAICEAVGKPYYPTEAYTLVLIDNDVAAEDKNSEIINFIPTNERLAEFMEQEAITDKDLAPVRPLIKTAMAPSYSFYYEYLVNQAERKKIDLGESEDLQELAKKLGFDQDQADLLEVRQKLNKKFGANEQFLGSGLTNDKTAGNEFTPFGPPQKDKQYGVCEVYTYDKKPITLGKLQSLGVITKVALHSRPA